MQIVVLRLISPLQIRRICRRNTSTPQTSRRTSDSEAAASCSPRSSFESPANSWSSRERSSCKYDFDCTFPDRGLEIRTGNSRNRLSTLDSARTFLLGCSIHIRRVYTCRSPWPRTESSSPDVNGQQAFHFSDICCPNYRPIPAVSQLSSQRRGKQPQFAGRE